MDSPTLSPSEALLVDVSAALALPGTRDLERALRAALSGEADSAAVEEVLLQGYLFVGYPRVLAAFGVWRELSGKPSGPPEAGDWERWRARGEEACRRVYGPKYEALRAAVRALHGDLELWMVVEGYGKVLGRPGLTLRCRELCVLALLAVLDAPVQLRSHLRGALNAGAGTDEVEAALRRALRLAGPEAGRRALETWDVVRSRREARGPEAEPREG